MMFCSFMKVVVEKVENQHHDRKGDQRQRR